MADGSGLVPPNDLDAEAAVLSACLLDGTRAAIDAARAVVQPGQFYADANKIVFGAILELDDAGQAPDVVLVAKLLRDGDALGRVGGTPYLAQLADATPSVANVAAHAQIVADTARQREMISVCRAAMAEGYQRQDDVTSWALTVAQKTADVARVDPKNPPELMAEILPRVIKEADTRAKHGIAVSGVNTGWAKYTDLLGGWKRGKMHVVGGRPGMGKTSFVLGAAINVARQGLGVVFPSAEMTSDELVQRALGVEARIDVRDIESGRLNQQQWSALTSAAHQLAALPISFVHKPGARIAEIRSAIRTEQPRLRRKGASELGLVIVDYIQILDGEREKGETREAEVARLSKRLMWLAGEFEVPILVVSQLNRSLESRTNKSKRPTMADLRESGAIEQDAYSVTLLYRDDYYNPGSEDAGVLEAIIGKNRGGPTGTVRLGFRAECTAVTDLDGQTGITYPQHNATGGDEYDGYDDYAAG